MDLKATYNRIAEDWATDHAADTWWVEGTNTFCSFLKPGATILDVGCGAGHKTKFFAEKGFKVKGTDFSENMIEVARRNYPGLSFEVRDIHEVDDESEMYDAVFAQAVLLHVKKTDVVGVLSKMKRRLNPGGLIYIAVKERREGKPEEENVRENDYGYEYERFFSFYRTEELEGYFAQIGMKVIWKTVTSSGRTNWIQIVAKKV